MVVRLLPRQAEDKIVLDRAVAFVGENNSGKCTFAALLAKEFEIPCYDFDELEKLSRLYPEAKKGDFAAGIGVFPREKQSFIYLAHNPMPAVIFTLPQRHNLMICREIKETLELCRCRPLGVVVNMARAQQEAEKISRELGLPLLAWFSYYKSLDEACVRGSLADYKPERRLREMLREFALKLREV